MRKALFISLAILLVAGIAFAATPGYRQSPGQGDKLGQGGLQSDPGKIFRLVRYVPAGGTANSATLSADSIVIWDCTSDDGVTVTTTTTSGDTSVAGIVVKAALTPETLSNTAVQDIGKRNWTWLQTYGLSQVDMYVPDNVVPVKGAIVCSGHVGQATGYLHGQALTAVGVAGFAMDAAAALATNVEVFLRLD